MKKYKEVEEIGHGSFARVIVVENKSGQKFAKKLFSPMENLIDAVGEDHLKKRFKREVKYQSKIQHQNIVTILGYELDQEPPYFIMPLAECTLQEELKSASPLGGEYKKVLFDVLAGLECMHDLGYVHRDLKPANILKFRSSDSHYYSISDFGLMSVAQSDSTTLTGSNVQGGTQYYAAPELMKNFRAATRLADIYSFGAILHDIFGNGAKRVPYTELSLPGPIGEIIKKCTKKVAARRYQSISALRDELYQVLDDTEVEFSSSKEEDLVRLLKDNDKLDDEQWDDVFLMIEEQSEGLSNCRNIFAAISEAHIIQLYNETPELFNALGNCFSEFIKSNSFDFDYCDILASKAEIFYDKGDIELKSYIALALLELGTSHNRWYVERKFVRLVGPEISLNLAKRIISEVEVEEIDLEAKILHIERSISISRASYLHPLIVQHLREIA